jgi:hypothetical protein
MWQETYAEERGPERVPLERTLTTAAPVPP